MYRSNLAQILVTKITKSVIWYKSHENLLDVGYACVGGC